MIDLFPIVRRARKSLVAENSQADKPESGGTVIDHKLLWTSDEVGLKGLKPKQILTECGHMVIIDPPGSQGDRCAAVFGPDMKQIAPPAPQAPPWRGRAPQIRPDAQEAFRNPAPAPVIASAPQSDAPELDRPIPALKALLSEQPSKAEPAEPLPQAVKAKARK